MSILYTPHKARISRQDARYVKIMLHEADVKHGYRLQLLDRLRHLQNMGYGIDVDQFLTLLKVIEDKELELDGSIPEFMMPPF